MASVFLAHPSSLEHDTGAHPEQAARIFAIERELAQAQTLGFERVRSPRVDREVLTAVHPPEYVSMIERISANGGGALDPDTIASAGSFEAALHGAGGAVRLVELLLDREAPYGFSAHRPPGHHATRNRAMGFCLFNNIAVAARFALDERGVSRVMILDWDVHHGNGTNDIFHASDRVLFMSIHQSPLYPGTGPASDVGEGPGDGFTVNVPVSAGTGDSEFRSLVDHVAVPLLHSFEPELVLISAGYDAHMDDPLGSCRVSEQGFALMTRSVRRACDAIGVPVGCVLEGGYAVGALARSVLATMRELTPEPPGGADDELEPQQIALEVRERLARWWDLPSLASPA
jgi:acetoin utilization deacetylase AcuC-like enzyme